MRQQAAESSNIIIINKVDFHVVEIPLFSIQYRINFFIEMVPWHT